MADLTKIGIIICDRYRRCAGGKCFKALQNREGAFSAYLKTAVQVVGYTTCDGCPGGNVEYAPAEMKKNGADIIHLATGLMVGYPPCPYLFDFIDLIRAKYELKVAPGTHPIPEKYYVTHQQLGTWETERWRQVIQPILANHEIRLQYD